MKSPTTFLLNVLNESIERGIAPLELYILLKISNKEILSKDTIPKSLFDEEYLKLEKETVLLTSKGLTFLTKLLSEKPQVVLDPKLIRNYNEIFPSKKLPSGKLARVNVQNLIPAFRWFVDNFEYDWETILKATERYVNEYALKGYKFMQTSQYFIRKQQSDRTWSSELANYCQLMVDGEDEDFHFKENVV